jgi:hypothetical protein
MTKNQKPARVDIREEDLPDYNEEVSDEVMERNLRAIHEATDLSVFEIDPLTFASSVSAIWNGNLER